MTNLIHMGVVRQQVYFRLHPLLERIRNKQPAKVYLTGSGGIIYDVYYNNLTSVNLSYHGTTAFVKCKSTTSISLCHLELLPKHSLTYKAQEVKTAFSRCRRRMLQIDESQIMGYLLPCLEQ